MGRGGAMYESIHVRITVEQYEWLRRYCFENRVAQAEVVREALDMFRNQKEAQNMASGGNAPGESQPVISPEERKGETKYESYKMRNV